MEIINFYVPSELCQIVNIATEIGSCNLKTRYCFEIIYDEQYYLTLKDTDIKTEIPNAVIQNIVADAKSYPHAVLFCINKYLTPLKQELIRQSLKPEERRIDLLLQDAKGYFEKENNIIFFFDKNHLTANMTEKQFDISFTVTGHVYKTIDSEIAYGNTGVIYAYYDDGLILKYTVEHKDGLFMITSIIKESDIKYRTLYEQNKNAESIYTAHTAKKRNLFSKILLK